LKLGYIPELTKLVILRGGAFRLVGKIKTILAYPVVDLQVIGLLRNQQQ
jgi:hypothetical protein